MDTHILSHPLGFRYFPDDVSHFYILFTEFDINWVRQIKGERGEGSRCR